MEKRGGGGGQNGFKEKGELVSHWSVTSNQKRRSQAIKRIRTERAEGNNRGRRGIWKKTGQNHKVMHHLPIYSKMGRRGFHKDVGGQLRFLKGEKMGGEESQEGVKNKNYALRAHSYVLKGYGGMNQRRKQKIRTSPR